MSPNIFCEVAKSAVASEREKISAILHSQIPDGIKKVCKQLEEFLQTEVSTVNDEIDLIALRSKLQTISSFVNLVVQADPSRSSWWPEPLIRECYRLCDIDCTNRDIAIIHLDETSIDDFAVYANALVLLEISSYLQNNTHARTLDIFVIPAETRFDISSIALIGHEVGHVYWQTRRELLGAHVKNEYGPQPEDWIEKLSYEDDAERMASHIEEYLCDQIGSRLFGPAFDFALIKLFLSYPSVPSGDTHPPTDFRINLSYEKLEEYTKKGSSHAKLVKEMADSLGVCQRNATTDRLDARSINLAKRIDDKDNPVKRPLQEEELGKIWADVVPELDAFRPPIECVSSGRPKPIGPIAAVVATTLYFHGAAYKKSNHFFIGNDRSEVEKCDILRQKLCDHLRYAIGLNQFVSFSQNKLVEFTDQHCKNTLWDWRTRETSGIPNPLVIVPTIDPEEQYGANSVDLRLGCSFLVNMTTRYTHCEPSKQDGPSLKSFYQRVWLPIGSKFVLHPHEFVLAAILEYISLPTDHFALVLGRSTWGRLGLNIATATTVQAGYRGCLTGTGSVGWEAG